MKLNLLKFIFWNLIIVSLLTFMLLMYFNHEDKFSNIFVFWTFILIIPLVVGLCGAFVFIGKHYLRLLFSATPLVIAPILYKPQNFVYLPDAEATSLLIVYVFYWLVAASIILYLSEYLRRIIKKRD